MAHPVFLKNGDQVKVNDHVYCSPSWEARDGTPYSIARIMEFLPPEDVPKGPEGKNYLYTRVRLAWYYRPSDVSDRTVADSRLLLAAIYSEKEFEVIQSTDVRNIPDHTREILTSRYEYIVAEKEVVADLTDNIRLCATCNEWCSSAETVQCDRCKKYFHMGCVQPPLQAKPSRGYGWTCAPCSRKHEEEVDSHDVRYPTPSAPRRTNAPPARGRGRPRKDRAQAEREENFPVKHFNLWPFRYFGQYTVAEDTLDPEDLIFPRTATRQGPKYQANVPSAPDPYNHPPDIDERGGDNTVEVLGIINSLTEAEGSGPFILGWVLVSKSCRRKLQMSVDWLTEVIRRFSEAALAARPFTAVNMKDLKRTDKWTKEQIPYRDEEWSREEVITFEDAIMHHNAELRAVRDEVVTRTMPEVVRFYGHWKNQKLGEQHKRIKEVGEPPKPVHNRYRTEEEASNGQRVGLSDDESSIVAGPASRTPTCGACRTRDSPIWWKAPKGLSTSILCENCGTNWRKYADLNLVRQSRDESLTSNKTRSANDKREGTPLSGPSSKRAKTSASVQSTPPPPPSTAPQIRCLACTRTGPLGKVLKCQKCEVRVHAGSCGAFLLDATKPEKWICELCDNEETQEASLNPDCVLCPRGRNQDRKKKPYPPADSFLRISKQTEQSCWAHVLCAVFSPEILFADASRLRLIEGINTISNHRWSTACTICNTVQGAVIRCNDCPKEFHASCAWKQGHRFGFEIQPVKSSRRDTTTTVNFKGETGCMNAIVSCKDHDHSRRSIYDICETNEGGETALQVYVQSYKQAPTGQAHGLLRKARRLDNILNTRSESSTPSNPPTPQPRPSPGPECYQCRTQYSPTFYPTEDSDQFMCHKCHWYMESRSRMGNGPSSRSSSSSTGMVVS
ncbi:SANT domain-containing protein 2 [Leucoagaricus sp. SymC.cos]|nr:SANT domain-containing protein 2 [Leucoagaricus sp. SymC.cos]